MFVGVVIREKVVVPPVTNMMIYGALYEDVWLRRYSDMNMDHRHEKYLQRLFFLFFYFLMTLIEFALVSEKAIKNFCLGGRVEIHPRPPGGGGGGDHPLRIRSSFRKSNKKILPCGGGFPPGWGGGGGRPS